MLKEKIRKIFKEKRKAFSLKEKEDYSKMIADLVSSNFDLKSKIVSVFLPIERLNEVDTSFVIDYLKRVGSIVTSPVSDFGNMEMKHLVLNNQTRIEKNKWDIPEPVGGEEVSPDEFDFVFVPLLAINKDGFRVGYGKGFYDRFLSQCNKSTVFIGLNYFEDTVEIDDINEDDVPLHFVATPNQLLKF